MLSEGTLPGHSALTAAAQNAVHSAAATAAQSAAASAAAAAALAAAAAKKPPRADNVAAAAGLSPPGARDGGNDGAAGTAPSLDVASLAGALPDPGPGGVEILQALFPNTRISVQTAPPAHTAPAGMPGVGMLGPGARSPPSALDARMGLNQGGRGGPPGGPGLGAALGALGVPMGQGPLGSPGLLGAFGPPTGFGAPGGNAPPLGSLGSGISESLGQNKQPSWMPSLRETPPMEDLLAGFHASGGQQPPRIAPDIASQSLLQAAPRRHTPAGAAPGPPVSGAVGSPPQVVGGGEKGGGRRSHGGQEKRSSNQRRNRG